MSIAATTQDKLTKRRKQSLNEERSIARNTIHKSRLLSDASTVHPAERLIGLAVLPLALFCSIIIGIGAVGMAIGLIIFKLGAKVIPFGRLR